MKLLGTPNPADEGKDLPLNEDVARLVIPCATHVRLKEFTFGQVLIQEYLSVPVKIFIYHFFANFDAAFYAYFEQPTIALQFMTAGSVEALLQGLHTPLDTGHFGLFFLPVSMNEVKLPKGYSKSLHFELNESYLDDLAATHPSVRDLLDKLFNATQKAERLGPVPVNYEVNHHLLKIAQLKKDDEGLQMEFKIIILSLLNLYRKGIVHNEKMAELESIKVPNQELVEKVYHLIQEKGNYHDHDIPQFARENNITDRTFRRSFKTKYKISLRSFVNETRMERAYNLVMMTMIPLEEISEMLNYKEFEQFYIAFSAKFHISPRKLRASDK